MVQHMKVDGQTIVNTLMDVCSITNPVIFTMETMLMVREMVEEECTSQLNKKSMMVIGRMTVVKVRGT